MEYWIVYDLATGAYRYAGSGPEGSGALQLVPEGCVAVSLPFPVFAALPADLDPLKAHSKAAVDAEAGDRRAVYITASPGQSETYIYKSNEARAWLADNSSPTPFLTPEAEARGMTIAALAAEVLANESAWRTIGGKIEGARVAAKEAIQRATTIGEVIAASKVVWPG